MSTHWLLLLIENCFQPIAALFTGCVICPLAALGTSICEYLLHTKGCFQPIAALFSSCVICPLATLGTSICEYPLVTITHKGLFSANRCLVYWLCHLPTGCSRNFYL